MAIEKKDPQQREKDFIRYFSMSVYVMQVSKYCLNMAKAFTAESKVKNVLTSAERIMASNINSLLVNCNRRAASEFRADLEGEEVMALGSILTELITLERIVDVEDQLIKLIRQLRKQEPGYLRAVQEESNELQVEPGTTTPILPDDIYYRYHSVGRGECSRCFHLFNDTEPIIFVWPNAGEEHHGEPGEYRFCKPCLESAGVIFKTKTVQYEQAAN